MSIEKAGTALVKAAGNKVAEKVANSANPFSGGFLKRIFGDLEASSPPNFKKS